MARPAFCGLIGRIFCLIIADGAGNEFHCLFGPSQLRRLGPKRLRNTDQYGALPRAARAFGAACPGLVCFALSALLPLRGGNARREKAAWLKQQVPWIPLNAEHRFHRSRRSAVGQPSVSRRLVVGQSSVSRRSVVGQTDPTDPTDPTDQIDDRSDRYDQSDPSAITKDS